MSKRVRAQAGSAYEQQEDEDAGQSFPLERKHAHGRRNYQAATALAALSPAPRNHYEVMRDSAERCVAYLAWVLAPVVGDREEVGAGENDPIVEACYALVAAADQAAGLEPLSPVPEEEDF